MENENITTSLGYLSDLCLENSGIKTDYSDEDLSNAVLIFMEVLSNKMFDHHAPNITQEQGEKLWEEAGKSLRQTVLLFTGVDLHEAVQGKKTNLS